MNVARPGGVRQALRSRRAEIGVGASLVVLLAWVWLHTTDTIRQNQADAEAAGLANAKTLALDLSLQWAETTQRIDQLHQMARMVARGMLTHSPATADRIAELRRTIAMAGPVPFLDAAALDEHGIALWSTQGPAPEGLDLSDRDHVRAIIEGGKDSFVGQPVTGRISNRRSIHFSEAIRDPDRTLRGITVVTMSDGILQDWARQMSEDNLATVTIIRDDGIILARSDGLLVGQKMPANAAIFGQARRTGKAAAHVLSPIDNADRFTAIRLVQGSPILLVASLSATSQLAVAQAQSDTTRQSATLLSTALIALAAASIGLIRRQRTLERERRHRESLEQRDRLLRQIGEQATDVICLLDQEERYLFVSEAIRAMVGHDPASLIGRRFGLSLIEEDRPLLAAALVQLRRDGGAVRASGRIRHRDGTLLWVDAELVAVEPMAGDPSDDVKILAVVRNMTERFEQEAALRAAKEQLEGALRLGPGLLYRLTSTGNGQDQIDFPAESMAWANQHAALPQNHRITSAMMPFAAAEVKQAVAECRRSGHATALYQIMLASGDTLWIRNEMRLAEPGRCGIIGYLTDVTAEKVMAQRLQLMERLATLGEVAAGIAHEINQPLAAIALAAQNGARALRRGPGNEGIAVSKFELIDNQALRLGKVVEHIQTVGRGGKVPATRFALSDMIANVLALCRGRLTEAAVDATVAVAPDLPDLFTQRILLEQVIMNLLVNACDAYQERADPADGQGRRPLAISVLADRGDIEITVADRAGGIAPQALARLFDPFFTTKQPGKGVGLGLSISFTSITGLGGLLSARNEDGGAVFKVHLPAAICVSEPTKEVAPA